MCGWNGSWELQWGLKVFPLLCNIGFSYLFFFGFFWWVLGGEGVLCLEFLKLTSVKWLKRHIKIHIVMLLDSWVTLFGNVDACVNLTIT